MEQAARHTHTQSECARRVASRVERTKVMTEMVLRGRARESESMGGQDEGLTLQGLAKRLQTLERENVELRQEVSALRGSGARRDEVVALRGSDEHRDQEEPVSEFEERVSRRSLLSKAGAAAVAAVAAGTLLGTRQASADHYNDSSDATDAVFTHSVTAYRNRLSAPLLKRFTNIAPCRLAPLA